MIKSYYIHDNENWTEEELQDVRESLEELGFHFDKKAAIGEGSGGSGFDTVVEIVLSGIAINIVSNIIYDLAKRLVRTKPKNKAPHPSGGNWPYRLVVHVKNDTYDSIISVNLRSSEEELETAITENLDIQISKKRTRLDQEGKSWSGY